MFCADAAFYLPLSPLSCSIFCAKGAKNGGLSSAFFLEDDALSGIIENLGYCSIVRDFLEKKAEYSAMADTNTENIRNFLIAGHGGTGKTTLADAMLHVTKVTGRAGSVDDGTSFSDFDEQEKERKISISMSILNASWKGNKLNILDAPGYPEFSGEIQAGVRVAETMLVTVAAGNGLELNSRKAGKTAETLGRARIIVLNKMDGENIDYDALMESLRKAFGANCVPYNLPIGVGASFKGVVSVLDGQATDGLVGDIDSARESLMEAVVETDEELMERYLEGEEIPADQIKATFRKAVAAGQVVPVVHTAAKSEAGVEGLLNAICEIAPSPADLEGVKALKGEEEIELACDASGPAAAFVFKAKTDPFVGKISYFRVFSGTIKGDSAVVLARTGGKLKLGHIFCVQGKENSEINELVAGDIGAVAKLDDLGVGDAIVDNANVVEFPEIKFPVPLVSLAISPKSRDDEKRLSGTLTKLCDGDKTFVAKRNAQTHELVVSGMSTLHLEIMLARMKSQFDVEVETKEPKIAYFEAISGKADGHYRHKKQTGGRGQFAEVYLRVEPTEVGAGLDFVNDIFGGSIPSNYLPAIEKGVRAKMVTGVVAGCPINDVRVSVYDGKFHAVDSSEAAFKMAGGRAFADAFEKAKPALLEPLVNVEITIPSQFMGDVTGNINTRRGSITGMESEGDMQVVRAEIPLSEVMHYSTELRSMTGGQGSFAMEFSRYEVLPQRMMAQVVEKLKKEQAEKAEED